MYMRLRGLLVEISAECGDPAPPVGMECREVEPLWLGIGLGRILVYEMRLWIERGTEARELMGGGACDGALMRWPEPSSDFVWMRDLNWSAEVVGAFECVMSDEPSAECLAVALRGVREFDEIVLCGWAFCRSCAEENRRVTGAGELLMRGQAGAGDRHRYTGKYEELLAGGGRIGLVDGLQSGAEASE